MYRVQTRDIYRKKKQIIYFIVSLSLSCKVPGMRVAHVTISDHSARQ